MDHLEWNWGSGLCCLLALVAITGCATVPVQQSESAPPVVSVTPVGAHPGPERQAIAMPPAAQPTLAPASAGGAGDRDGDGVPDSDDQCPDEPEDRDGFQDADGCPDPDNDADGIPDLNDKCPNQPETINGLQDDDGCPDAAADRDKDGIPDSEDKCPDAGGPSVIRARSSRDYGCPDSDRDGIADRNDKCPNDPEDTDGFQDDDGCPDPDNDGDGVPDVNDDCVDTPGKKSNHGCP